MSRSKRPSVPVSGSSSHSRPAATARAPSALDARSAPAPADAAAATRAATALAVTLAVLLVARAVLVFVPSMAAWGINVQRFLPLPAAWLPWMIAALALVPAVARRAAPALEAIGNAIARGLWFQPIDGI